MQAFGSHENRLISFRMLSFGPTMKYLIHEKFTSVTVNDQFMCPGQPKRHQKTRVSHDAIKICYLQYNFNLREMFKTNVINAQLNSFLNII